jgi:hypothetical protein
LPVVCGGPGHNGEAAGRGGGIGEEDFDTIAAGGAIEVVGESGDKGISGGGDAEELFCMMLRTKKGNLMWSFYSKRGGSGKGGRS